MIQKSQPTQPGMKCRLRIQDGESPKDLRSFIGNVCCHMVMPSFHFVILYMKVVLVDNFLSNGRELHLGLDRAKLGWTRTLTGLG